MWLIRRTERPLGSPYYLVIEMQRTWWTSHPVIATQFCRLADARGVAQFLETIDELLEPCEFAEVQEV